MAMGLHRFMSHFINCLEHVYLEIDTVKFQLDGRPILYNDPDSGSWRQLNYEIQQIDKKEIFQEYSPIDEIEPRDSVCANAAAPNSLSVSWQFLIDAISSFENGHYRGAVIYSCCAVEIEISPFIRDWLARSTYTHSKDVIESTLANTSNQLKLEVVFSSGSSHVIDSLPGEKRGQLLKQLKWLNSIRNRVVHYGSKVEAAEAKKAVRIAGLLLRILWIQNRQQYLADYGIEDIFVDFGNSIQEIDI